MTETDAKSPVSLEVYVARLPEKGLPLIFEADKSQLEALASAHGLLSVESYRVDLLVKPWKRRGVKVTGVVEADVTQACVVSLEPIAAHIREDVEGVFLPKDSSLVRHGTNTPGEIMLDVDGPDSPEFFEGDVIDAGELAEQFFGLAIDPYPRKPDASLSISGEIPPDETEFQKKLRGLL